MNKIAIQYIRKSAKKGYLDFSPHAIERMMERAIKDREVENCILKGSVIECQDFVDEDIKVLFQDATDTIPEIYAVVVAVYPKPIVVTVCKFKEEAWEFVNGIMKRRRK